MARSGSLSRASRGVSSWSAAVSMPTRMSFGTNGVIVTAVSADTKQHLHGQLVESLVGQAPGGERGAIEIQGQQRVP